MSQLSIKQFHGLQCVSTRFKNWHLSVQCCYHSRMCSPRHRNSGYTANPHESLDLKGVGYHMFNMQPSEGGNVGQVEGKRVSFKSWMCCTDCFMHALHWWVHETSICYMGEAELQRAGLKSAGFCSVLPGRIPRLADCLAHILTAGSHSLSEQADSNEKWLCSCYSI